MRHVDDLYEEYYGGEAGKNERGELDLCGPEIFSETYELIGKTSGETWLTERTS